MVLLGTMSVSAQTAASGDVGQAMARVRSRAESGRVVAQFTLGSILHYAGLDTVEALTWFQRAAAAGHAPAQFQLGQLYQLGFGVPQDDAVALMWYRRAAAAGLAPAERVVGDFYRLGRAGLVPDATEAARWYRRAAEGDDIRAQYALGQMYFDGADLSRDYGEAYLFFALAAAQAPLADNRKALVELRNIAAARMTPEAVADAERRVAAWPPASH